MTAAEQTTAAASRLTLACFMVVTGGLHFVITSTYARIVPRALGHAEAIVEASGAAQMLAGALLAVPRTKRVGAWMTVVLLVAVFPANVQMALDGGIAGAGFPWSSGVLAWVRLPLQLPLVAWAHRHTRASGLATTRSLANR